MPRKSIFIFCGHSSSGFFRGDLSCGWRSVCSLAPPHYAAIALIALMAGSPFGILTRFRFLGAVFMLSIANLLFVGTMGLALLAATSRWKAALNISFLAFFGDISYGLYLIHWLVFIAYDAIVARYFGPAYSFVANFKLLTIRFCVVFVAATFLAWLSRRYYEERFLRLKSRFS